MHALCMHYAFYATWEKQARVVAQPPYLLAQRALLTCNDDVAWLYRELEDLSVINRVSPFNVFREAPKLKWAVKEVLLGAATQCDLAFADNNESTVTLQEKKYKINQQLVDACPCSKRVTLPYALHLQLQHKSYRPRKSRKSSQVLTRPNMPAKCDKHRQQQTDINCLLIAYTASMQLICTSESMSGWNVTHQIEVYIAFGNTNVIPPPSKQQPACSDNPVKTRTSSNAGDDV